MWNCYDSAKQNWELTNKHGVAKAARNGDQTPRTAMRSNQDLGFAKNDVYRDSSLENFGGSNHVISLVKNHIESY